ncbi:hypothetical protein [Oceanirhabdus sp. W0125-5]|uniref:hypothetical protein n=1 Tax=Oceanirhabdus sp. W0125-5 TaxID=2999116 RepID=UPI0022F2D1EF|nr:hypothetical protein [Oceanirhabdus sp. W0125-5]WBW96696.1 hypothetical protein OW730_23830 [Oceanirhabdus sp. W0125-5]
MKKLISKICPFFMVPDSNPVDVSKYEKNPSLGKEIYIREGKDEFIPLIDISTEGGIVDNICLVDFKGDSIYNCIELQQVRKNGKSHYVAIMATLDHSQVDIYFNEEAGITEEDYNSMFNKLTINPCKEMKAGLELTEKGLMAFLDVNDRNNRKVEFYIEENRKRKECFGLIAPMGINIKKPDFFPMVYLKKFNMIKQRGTKINIKIDNKELKPIKLLPLCNFQRVYMLRYSFNNIIRQWNNNYNGEVKPLRILEDETQVIKDNCIYEIEKNHGHLEVKSVTHVLDGKKMSVTLYPPLPDILSLKDDCEIKGNFSFSGDEIKGILGGSYKIKKNNNKVKFQLHPEIGWQPMPGKLWMSTYIWKANYSLNDDKVTMDGKWSRKYN